MRNLLLTISDWQNEGKTVALATVVRAYGSSPRPLGAKMVISSAGEMAGSVSGGCVEGAVLQEALAVIDSGQPKLLPYGISDEWAQDVGLACGGSIEVLVELLEAGISAALADCLESNQLVALATVVGDRNLGAKLLIWPDGRAQGDLGGDELNQTVLNNAVGLLTTQTTERRTFEIEGEVFDIFIEVFAPPPRLIVVGAVHIAIPLVRFARELGFQTTVIDARSAFATPERFAYVDHLIVQWPEDALAGLALDEGCYITILSHDDKLDVPALRVALESRARYIGALGSRNTMAGRAEKLREMGIADEQLARIHNPIGLNLGGRRPEEIALAIMAEIVSVRNGA